MTRGGGVPGDVTRLYQTVRLYASSIESSALTLAVDVYDPSDQSVSVESSSLADDERLQWGRV